MANNLLGNFKKGELGHLSYLKSFILDVFLDVFGVHTHPDVTLGPRFHELICR